MKSIQSNEKAVMFYSFYELIEQLCLTIGATVYFSTGKHIAQSAMLKEKNKDLSKKFVYFVHLVKSPMT